MSKANLDHTHKFYKLISLLGFGVVGASAIITIPFISTSCGENYAENEVNKCNYTVNGYTIPGSSTFYIGKGIKGYISGGITVSNFTVNNTCTVTTNGSEFAGCNLYLPKYVFINGGIYRIISAYLSSQSLEGKIVLPNNL
jgi:hypothetical protein